MTDGDDLDAIYIGTATPNALKSTTGLNTGDVTGSIFDHEAVDMFVSGDILPGLGDTVHLAASFISPGTTLVNPMGNGFNYILYGANVSGGNEAIVAVQVGLHVT